jgi:hypothetical protein
MTIRYDAKTIVIAAVALVLAAGLGYWGYTAYKTRELRAGIAVLVKDAGGRLRDALGAEAGPAPANHEQLAKTLDEHAAAVEKLAERLNRLELGRDRAFSDDADSLLVTIREILRRQASIHRLYLLHTESLQTLRDHMRADNRTGAWVRQAVRTKERAEKDFRDYRLVVASYATVLGSFPVAQKRVASHVGPAPLVEEALIGKARERALETAMQAEVEMEKVRRLVGPK